MQNRRKMTVVLPIVLLVVALVYVPSASFAPRSDLQFLWGFPSPDDAYLALKSGLVDILCMDLTAAQKEDVESDPNLQICRYEKNSYFEFALNNNKTIIDHPNKLSPTNVKEIRQALAYLINKTYIITDILHGYGVQIDQPIPYSQIGWCDPSVIGENYPYKYNPDNAVRLLARLGFNDTDGNGYLNYPNDPRWIGAAGLDTTVMPLKIVARIDDPYSSCARYLYRQLEGDPAIAGDSIIASSHIWEQYGLVGGDFDTTDEMWIKSWFIIQPIVEALNFHVYVWSWSVRKFPLHLYFIYHGGPRSITNYEHPELDLYLEQFYYAYNIVDAIGASKRACKYMAENAVTIPLWSPIAYQSWRKGVGAVVNMLGYGINNKYTYINAHKGGQPWAPLRVAIPWAFQLNVIYSSRGSEWEVLNAIYPHLINVEPYDIYKDQPWIAQDWEINPQINRITFWIRKDAGIGTPNPVIRPFNYTAHDVEFTIWYTYAFRDGWNWPLVKDIYYTKTLDNHTIQIYFRTGTMSCWQLCNIGSLPLLCDEIIPALSNAPSYPLLTRRTYSFMFPGQNKLPDHVVRVISATADGIPIYEGKNFTIRTETDTYRRDLFVPENINLEPPWNITITYWYAPNRPTGKYLGSDAGLTWYDTMYTPGPHYVSSYSDTSVYLSKNLLFFLSPPLGEVDWVYVCECCELPFWMCTNPARPRRGYFLIDIFDVVRCTAAYNSRGDGEYDPRYFPGADLNGDCEIDIYDVVTITGKYGLTFGKPP